MSFSQALNLATLNLIGMVSLGFGLELVSQPIAIKESQPICLGQLNSRITQLIDRAPFNHAWITVVVAESNATINTERNIERNTEKIQTVSNFLVNLEGDRFFIPASSLKLFTTAAALKILSPDYQIVTRILSGKLAKDGILNHDLIVEGNGDPSFSSTSLQNLVSQLKSKGIRVVKGKLILSDRLQVNLPIGWEWNDLQEEYSAIPHGFTINGNVLNWQISPAAKIGKPLKFVWQNPKLAKSWIVENRSTTQANNSNQTLEIERTLGKEQLNITGALNLNDAPELGATAVPEPLTHFKRLLEIELANQNIAIANQSLSNSQSSNSLTFDTLTSNTKQPVIYAEVLSPTVKQLIRTINKESDNLYAENLYQIILQQRPGKWQQFWQAIKIPIDYLRIYDGSGLSRRNAIRAEDLVKLLQIMAKEQDFRDSLAIAGIDGTLKNRLRNTSDNSLSNIKIWAKTGTMSGVSVLAGYLKPANYPELVFTIAINHGSLSNKENQNLVDAIAFTLSSLKSCS